MSPESLLEAFARRPLLSDGATIYAAHSPDEVVDVFRRGQGVFGIAVGPVEEELVGELHVLEPEVVHLDTARRAEAKAN